MCFCFSLDWLQGAVEYCNDWGNDSEGQGNSSGRDQGKGITDVTSIESTPANVSVRYWGLIAKVSRNSSCRERIAKM